MSRDSAERSSTSGYPRDRFDALPQTSRVGAHRLTGRVRRAWRYVLAGAIATVVLVGAGVFYINSLGGGSQMQLPLGPPIPQEDRIIPQLDPTATIAVLNGTPTPNLAAGVDSVVTANQWGQIAFSDDADSRDVAISAVFYADEADLPAAEGLAQKLGGVSTYQSDGYTQYGVRLVVLLGVDYAGPGYDEAAALTEQLNGEAVARAQ